jgi:omega-amidase
VIAMSILCVQLDIVWEDKPANHAKVRRLLDEARPAPSSLVLLPEMFATGFSMNVAGISDSQTHQTQQFLGELARDLGVFVLGGVVSTAPDGRGRNEALLCGPDGQQAARYQKLHPFTFGGESKHYEPGPAPVFFGWQGFVACPFICYDLRFPEAFRWAVRRGAELFCVIANWPASREHHWLTLLAARAIENQAYVAAVNRCGNDPRLSYRGRSVIVDPRGQIIADAGNDECIIRAEPDVGWVRKYRAEFPVLADMRDIAKWA